MSLIHYDRVILSILNAGDDNYSISFEHSKIACEMPRNDIFTKRVSEVLEVLRLDILSCSSYLPDVVPSDYDLFLPIHSDFSEQRFQFSKNTKK